MDYLFCCFFLTIGQSPWMYGKALHNDSSNNIFTDPQQSHWIGESKLPNVKV